VVSKRVNLTMPTGLICPHCKGDQFKVIADLTIGGVPYVYITKETIAIGFECWTCGEQYLHFGLSCAFPKSRALPPWWRLAGRSIPLLNPEPTRVRTN
jgi:hypothetical protein